METLSHLIITFGYTALFGAVFAETGLFVGFFLPGDSLLFTAGLLAAKGDFNIYVVAIGCAIASILGNQVGYWFGAKFGRKLYDRPDSFLFRKEHLRKTSEFYDKYGKGTLILARFTPIVRTFAPILAGVAEMKATTFLQYNIIGGLLWGLGLPVLGYFAGNKIPNIDHYLMPILVVIIVLSLVPAIWHLIKKK